MAGSPPNRQVMFSPDNLAEERKQLSFSSQAAMIDSGCTSDSQPAILQRSMTENLASGRSSLSLRTSQVTHVRAGDVEITSRFGQIMLSDEYETFGGIVVLFNFAVMTMETNARAVGDNSLLEGIMSVNRVLLLYYTFESFSRLYVMKWKFFRSGWNYLDFFIVIEGLLGEVMEYLAVEGSSTDQVGMLKSLRMLRLVRLLRLLLAFKELYVLVAGVSRCMKTLFWAAGLIFMSLNVWAILSVEFLSSVTKELAESGGYDTCSWCGTAFSDIWLANLTWFQIVSGDGWSNLGRELVEAHPWTYIFFISNIFIVMWGLLNLIVAAIVESNIQARDDDIVSAAKMAERLEAEAFGRFANICRSMDSDGNGEVTVDEFKEFLNTSLELKNNLTVMGVHEDKLEGLLKLMDDDNSGTLDSNEFVKQFTRMRTLVLRTEVFYLVKYVENIQSTLSRQEAMIQSLEETVINQRTDGRHNVHRALTQSSSASSASISMALAQSSSVSSPNLPALSAETLITDLREKPSTKGSAFSAEYSRTDLREKLNTRVAEDVHATFDKQLYEKTVSIYPGRGSSKTIPQRDLIAFTEELDKRIDVILQRCDELPMAITREVLKSAHVCCPGDAWTASGQGNETMAFTKNGIRTADDFETPFDEALASPCRPTFSRVSKPESTEDMVR